ncbi:hypothetical protein GGR52DRAFT_542587 [Hypoxylon sp. FL1284]|nr:hypothetical protein GGR52DRAFT_542587 [Hypoxylon sp. FL1284]
MLYSSRPTWWHRNHLQGWTYPSMPTKKELIYRIFRAAYPQGAFVNDDLCLTELRSKDEIWKALDAQIKEADKDINRFVDELCQQETRLRRSQEKLEAVAQYYKALLDEAFATLYNSQNQPYIQFRCMEELLIRDRHAKPRDWTRDARPGHPPPVSLPTGIEGYSYAREQLDLDLASSVPEKLRLLRLLDPVEAEKE